LEHGINIEMVKYATLIYIFTSSEKYEF